MGILFVVNPVAGKGKNDFIVAKIKAAMSLLEISYEIKVTTKEKEAEEIVQKATSKGFTKIVAVGGDGTVYEVANGLVGSDIPLGVIPAGTGNDFARTVGIPTDIEKALKTIVDGKILCIDYGKANDRCFVNVASVGLDAEIVKATAHVKRYFSGAGAYIAGMLRTLLQFHYKEISLKIDCLNRKKNVMLVAIANGKYYGGGMKIAPMAEITDGILQVCVIDRLSKWKLIRLFPTIFSGSHVRHKEVKLYKGKEISIKSEQPLLINLDGDIIGESTSVKFEVVSQGIKVLVPRE